MVINDLTVNSQLFMHRYTCMFQDVKLGNAEAEVNNPLGGF